MVGISCTSRAQLSENIPHAQDPKFDKVIINTLDFSIPVISVDQLKQKEGEFILLDARERKEYEVSRIPGAKWVGYDDFDLSRVKDIDKDKPVLLYCSIGYRSEKIGERLKAAGFSNVYNLYGSIFEWANKGYPVEDMNGKPVKKLHAYNWMWGKWVDDEKVEKVYK